MLGGNELSRLPLAGWFQIHQRRHVEFFNFSYAKCYKGDIFQVEDCFLIYFKSACAQSPKVQSTYCTVILNGPRARALFTVYNALPDGPEFMLCPRYRLVSADPSPCNCEASRSFRWPFWHQRKEYPEIIEVKRTCRQIIEYLM